MIRWILSLSLLAAALLGAERGEIEGCIRSYARAIEQAARDVEFGGSFADRERLDACASDDVERRLYFWIVSWHENGLAMDANATAIELENLKLKGDTAEALTKERWIYSYRRKTPHGFVPASPPTATNYRVRYRLKRNDQGWRIMQIEVLEERSRKLDANR